MKDKKVTDNKNNLEKKIHELQEQLSKAQEKEKRALADYQNLVRRSQEDKIKLIKMANRDLLVGLLEPLEHLEMAAEQVQDNGLNMVVGQLVERLKEFGLEKIVADNKEFDVNTMEASEKSGQGSKVIKVLKNGYLLNGIVIQHAKVMLGD